MLTAFYIIVAVCVVFVVASLQIVRAHEKKMAAKREEARRIAEETGQEPFVEEEEFFSSPIYRAMEAVAHL